MIVVDMGANQLFGRRDIDEARTLRADLPLHRWPAETRRKTTELNARRQELDEIFSLDRWAPRREVIGARAPAPHSTCGTTLKIN